MQFGDLTVAGPASPKFLKAVAVLSEHLHPAFNEEAWLKPDVSKISCILSSLAVRDFLWKIGYKDAQVRTVLFEVRAYKDGKEIHSLGIGEDYSGNRHYRDPNKWTGHMIAYVPSEKFIIDTTLYQAQRDAWKMLPPMFATVEVRGVKGFGLESIAALRHTDENYQLNLYWFDQPENKKWRGAPDTAKDRRVNVVRKLVERFGSWKDTETDISLV